MVVVDICFDISRATIVFLWRDFSVSIEVEPEMEYLKQYGQSSGEESEEDFRGFDFKNGTGERFPSADPAKLPVPEVDQSVFSGSGVGSEPGTSFHGRNSDEEKETRESCDTDSSGSFSELRPKRKSGKRTKKEIKREDSARKRHLSHTVILDNCGCLKKCNENLTRDDRLQFHKLYWDLDNVGQGNLIRQYAHPKPIARRRSRKVSTDLVKQLALKCTLPSSSGDPVTVCRKFFLNTIGFRENCG